MGTILVYLSFRNIPVDSVLSGLQNIRLGYLFLASGLMVFMQVIRSYRWGILLSPLQKINFLTLFSVTNVGFLFLIAIPARLGELVRPYLISKKSSIRTSAALGTVVVERILDFFTLLLFLVIVFHLIPLPHWLIHSGLVILLLILAVSAILVVLIFKRDNLLHYLEETTSKKQSGKLYSAIRGVLISFMEGSKILVMPRIFLVAFLFSILFWFVDTLALYFTLKAVGLETSFTVALTVMIILIIAISLPTAPGYVGNWHYACLLGLSIFGIPKESSLPFGIIYHFISMATTVLLGLPFLPSNSVSIDELKKL